MKKSTQGGSAVVLTKLTPQGPSLACVPFKALYLILYLKCCIVFLKDGPGIVYISRKSPGYPASQGFLTELQ
jgi:hypothetical protein